MVGGTRGGGSVIVTLTTKLGRLRGHLMELRKKVWEHRHRRRNGAVSAIRHLDGLEDNWDFSEAHKKQH